MKKRITRREFVRTTAITAASVAVLPEGACSAASSRFDPVDMPTTRLGLTREVVPLMGFGCGSRWMSIQEDETALAILKHALDQGLYYWDTAASYGNERISSEERIGQILPGVREKVFLVSKTDEREGELVKESIQRSLTRLRTDFIDLLHVHSISSVEDAEQLGEKGRVLDVLLRYKREGIIRHIGFTGHSSAEGMRRAAELYDFEVMMMALNHQVPDGSQKFEEGPATFAYKKGMGVVAMKVIRPRETVEGLSAADLIRYALTLDSFHMINVGIDNKEVLDANIKLIKEFKPLNGARMDEIRLALQPFRQGDRLAWMQHGYRDGRVEGPHHA